MQKGPPSGNESGPELAPGAGFEPATDRLTADCSTAELPRIKNLASARHAGREGAVFWQSVPRHARPQKKPGSPKTSGSRKSNSWVAEVWRPGPESNRHTRICSPLHHHSATRPHEERRCYTHAVQQEQALATTVPLTLLHAAANKMSSDPEGRG